MLTSSSMKSLLTNLHLSFLLLIAVAHSSGIAAGEPIPADALKLNILALTNSVGTLFPGASIQVTNSTVGISYRVRKHRFAIPDKTGRMGPEGEITGPELDGFAIGIRFRQGTYHETLYRTRVPVWDKTRAMKRGPFFYTAVVKEWPERPLYMAIDIQFGADVDTNKVDQAYRLIVDAVDRTVSARTPSP